MKAFANVNPRTLEEAVDVLARIRESGASGVVTGGGSDLLGLVKDQLVQPDVVVNLKSIPGLDQIRGDGAGMGLGGLVTLETLSRHPHIREHYTVLAEAAGQVGTPQIRNVGTLAGNVCQRPWCWYLRNDFPCYKNGGDRCFARTGENQHHAIFGGGPSYIVHPSDTAPALVALGARFRITGPEGDRTVAAADFFTLPEVDAARENVLQDDEILAEVVLPPPPAAGRSTYVKLLDRESWTHALASAAVAFEMDDEVCRRASIVLGGVAPIPWPRPAAAALLAGRRITPDAAAAAADVAVQDARPLSKNRYKVPLTRGLVRRTVLALAERG